MTREKLGEILSAQTPTRTILTEGYEGEVTEKSEVVFLETDESGILIIHCKPNETI